MSHFATLVILPKDTIDDPLFIRQELAELLAPYNECDDDYYEFVEDAESDFDEEVGKNGYWRNPNAKWDWYEIGGRFSGPLHLVDKDEYDNKAVLRDVDTRRDEEAYKEACEQWDLLVSDDEADKEKLPPFHFSREYYLERYGDRETYARFCSDFMFRSVVTPDGEWHEVGRMGWFGVSDDKHDDIVDWILNYHHRFVEPYLDNIVVVVDCHI